MSLGSVTQETIDQAFSDAYNMTSAAMKGGPQRLPTSSLAVKTGISVGSNYLYGYPLEAPAKKLYPIEDAMRRRIPRAVNPIGGTVAHWKTISAINSALVNAGVAEGAVNTAITITDQERYMTYKTLNMYNTYTDEARQMSRRFEDVPAFTMLATLQSLMIEEDVHIIGGNITTLNTLMAANTLVPADSTGGSLTPTTNYDYGVSALTLHGYLNSKSAGKGGRGTSDTAGESQVKTLTSYTSGGAATAIELTWADVPGAFGYNVYIGTHSGTLYWQQTVTTNYAKIKTLPGAGNTKNTSDQTAETYGYSGLLEQIAVTSTGTTGSCYYLSKDNAVLTADGAGGISEFDTALQSIWNTARIGPTVMLVNAQESMDIKKLAIGSSSTNAVRVMTQVPGQSTFQAGAGVSKYYNPFTDQWIDIVTSIHMPPGKIMLLGERVPYPNAETPNNFEVELQQEYYGEEFARVARSQPVGVTCIGALKVYYPAACGIIANIKAN